MIDQEKHEIKQICIWNPITSRLVMFNIDSHHQYVISVTDGKHPSWRNVIGKKRGEVAVSQARTYSSKS